MFEEILFGTGKVFHWMNYSNYIYMYISDLIIVDKQIYSSFICRVFVDDILFELIDGSAHHACLRIIV